MAGTQHGVVGTKIHRHTSRHRSSLTDWVRGNYGKRQSEEMRHRSNVRNLTLKSEARGNRAMSLKWGTLADM
jgi:hypothetical protein